MLAHTFTSLIFLLCMMMSIPAGTASAAGTISQDAAVAGIPIGGLSYEEARSKVLAEIDAWKQGQPLQAEGVDETVSIPRGTFVFDVHQTFNEIEQESKRPWYLFFLKPKPVHVPLDVLANDKVSIQWPDYVDGEATLAKAKEEAAFLRNEPVPIVYKDQSALKQAITAEAVLPIPENIKLDTETLAGQINEMTIQPESSFSLTASVLEQISPTVHSETASFLATALYAAVLQTNMDIIQRHSHGFIPSYTEAGIEAAVNIAEKKDLIFHNPNFHSYTILSQVKNNRLYLSLYSVLKDSEYRYRVENIQVIKPRTLYRFSYDLEPGARVPIESGQSGLKAEIYRIQQSNGAIQQKTLISRDYYPPSPTVFLLSSQEPPEVLEGLPIEKELPGEAGSPLNSEEIKELLNKINEAACQTFEDATKRKACEQTLPDSILADDQAPEAKKAGQTDAAGQDESVEGDVPYESVKE
ncbi:VanW family protein [Siminovitchia sediminis]|uniref:VanW family protein n=1 Tax=Siminovitchia sediminis TaxID=1274353 RepID=A0ABW4KKW4_9BACI